MGIRALFAVTGIAIIALAAGVVFYDEAVDPDIQEQLRARQEVPDERNLYLAMLGAGFASKEPLHVAGRRILEAPDLTQTLTLGHASQSQIRELLSYCNAIYKDRISQWPAYRSCMGKMAGPIEDGMTDLTKQYRDLRGYPIFSTDIGSSDILPVPKIWELHLAFVKARLNAGIARNAPAELIEDVSFLRDALAKSDSLFVSILLAMTLERDFRLVSEIIELGHRERIEGLQALYLPAPSVTAINIKGLLLTEYRYMQNSVRNLRAKMMKGEDPLKELSEIFGHTSPIPESSLRRRISALRLKPNATANTKLEMMRMEIGSSGGLPRTDLFREIHNATGSAYLRFVDVGYGYSEYLTRFIDLDDYIRLIGLVGALSLEQTAFDPSKKVRDWAGKLSESAGSSLRWNEKFWGFEFKPTSRIWQEREKEAGVGVLVRVPPNLVPEVDAWQGYTARCAGARCELLRGNSKPLPARSNARLSEVQDGMPAVTSVSENSHVSISVFDPDPLGDIVERIVRLRPSAAARADAR